MEESVTEQNIVSETPKPARRLTFLLPVLAVIVAGILTGYGLQHFLGGKKSNVEMGESGIVSKENISKGKEFGEKNPVNADSATGVVEKGGINGEGTHKLLRDGGPSQTVYMTSSVLDLEQFVGEKIQIWGETNRAQKAGWLMDVVKVKVLE